jgi:hypothetical protein
VQLNDGNLKMTVNILYSDQTSTFSCYALHFINSLESRRSDDITTGMWKFFALWNWRHSQPRRQINHGTAATRNNRPLCGHASTQTVFSQLPTDRVLLRCLSELTISITVNTTHLVNSTARSVENGILRCCE